MVGGNFGRTTHKRRQDYQHQHQQKQSRRQRRRKEKKEEKEENGRRGCDFHMPKDRDGRGEGCITYSGLP
jgi:hypothetical protein